MSGGQTEQRHAELEPGKAKLDDLGGAAIPGKRSLSGGLTGPGLGLSSGIVQRKEDGGAGRAPAPAPSAPFQPAEEKATHASELPASVASPELQALQAETTAAGSPGADAGAGEQGWSGGGGGFGGGGASSGWDEPAAAVQLKADDAGTNGVKADAAEAVAAAASSSGQALPLALQRKFEASLGTDLSGVRVHTGGASEAGAASVSAQAYTVGNDVHFGRGRFDPSSAAGERLLAHEVAHTVQQAGGARRTQFKLEVSTPGDAFEIEADRAADAMVARQPAEVAGRSGRVAREKDDNEELADQGEKAAMKTAGGLNALKVSNVSDVASAQAALRTLEFYQPLVEAGVAQKSVVQAGSGYADAKTQMSVPLEAIGQNSALISDIQLYLAEAQGQGMATDEFQVQYGQLLANFGRVDAIAQGLTGKQLLDITPANAGKAVGNAAGAVADVNKTTRKDMTSTLGEIVHNDPTVRAAAQAASDASMAMTGQPELVADSLKSAINGGKNFQNAIASSQITGHAVNSMVLRQGLQQARAKGKEAGSLVSSALEIMGKGAFDGVKDVAKDAAKHVIAGNGIDLAKWLEMGEAGLASGGLAVGMDIVSAAIQPALNAIGRALDAADAARGYVPAAEQLEYNLTAEQAKQDADTINAYKMAQAGLSGAASAAKSAITAWAKASATLEMVKLKSKQAYKALSEAIKTASAGRGHAGAGKALAEMTGFLSETEQFTVQANTVLQIGEKGLGVGADPKEGKSVPEAARAALRKISGRSYMAVEIRKLDTRNGEIDIYKGVPSTLPAGEGADLNATDAEQHGQGHADGVDSTQYSNKLAANTVVPKELKHVKELLEKVTALKAEIMSQVFAGAAAGT